MGIIIHDVHGENQPISIGQFLYDLQQEVQWDSMIFDLYDAELGGLLIASVGPLAVDVADGLYSVDLPLVSAS